MASSFNQSEDLCYLLKRVANQMTRISDKSRSENPASGMGMILSLLVDGREMNQFEMANTLQIRNASLSEAIIKLEKKGYVVRRNNPNDRRSRLVSLTDKGIKAERMISEDRKRVSDAILSVLTDEEKDMLYALLHKLSNAYIEGRMQAEQTVREWEWEELGAMKDSGSADKESMGQQLLGREREFHLVKGFENC